MPQVAEAAYAEVMIDNQSLADRIATLEAKLAAMEATEATEPPMAADPVPPTPPVAAAPIAPVAKSKSGVAPLAKSHAAAAVSAKAKWNEVLQAKISSGVVRAKAVFAVDAENPGLRQQMIDEVNAERSA